ncbi:hypothetical protein GCK72_018941 [Caenorhabditis remanei]|nr:hypothetical protein GCK72_018941 [Caenorhabditis remanei]KAF1752386.1 hypothetical protein GCK72_018941 [Caenorhabditis remanei]
MLKNLIIAALIVVSVVGERHPDCTSEHAVLTMLNCTSTLLDMIEIAKAHPKDFESLKAYLECCEHFMTCDQSYKCQNNTKYEEDLRNHETKCIDNLHILEEFHDCERKLKISNTTCYQNYNPFKGNDIILKMAKKEKESCDTFFGEDDCMIKETIEKCGKTQAQRYQKELRIIAEALAICDITKKKTV